MQWQERQVAWVLSLCVGLKIGKTYIVSHQPIKTLVSLESTEAVVGSSSESEVAPPSPWSYSPDRQRDRLRSESRVWQQIGNESSLPVQFPDAYHFPCEPQSTFTQPLVPLTCKGRLWLSLVVFKTLIGFCWRRAQVDFVKESKWGAGECCACSILICVSGCWLSGSFPCITPWNPRCWALTDYMVMLKPNQGQRQHFLL